MADAAARWRQGRHGKGGKDRVVMLPRSVRAELERQPAWRGQLHEPPAGGRIPSFGRMMRMKRPFDCTSARWPGRAGGEPSDEGDGSEEPAGFARWVAKEEMQAAVEATRRLGGGAGAAGIRGGIPSLARRAN